MELLAFLSIKMDSLALVFVRLTHKVQIDRKTPINLPGEMEGWLEPNSLARFVVEVVEQLDTRAIEESYFGGGSAPYPPKMMLALIFYCYAKGIYSSRKIEQASYELIPVLYITGGTHPDHDSINTGLGQD